MKSVNWKLPVVMAAATCITAAALYGFNAGNIRTNLEHYTRLKSIESKIDHCECEQNEQHSLKMIAVIDPYFVDFLNSMSYSYGNLMKEEQIYAFGDVMLISQMKPHTIYFSIPVKSKNPSDYICGLILDQISRANKILGQNQEITRSIGTPLKIELEKIVIWEYDKERYDPSPDQPWTRYNADKIMEDMKSAFGKMDCDIFTLFTGLPLYAAIRNPEDIDEYEISAVAALAEEGQRWSIMGIEAFFDEGNRAITFTHEVLHTLGARQSKDSQYITFGASCTGHNIDPENLQRVITKLSSLKQFKQQK